jgi:hypothetical protein
MVIIGVAFCASAFQKNAMMRHGLHGGPRTYRVTLVGIVCFFLAGCALVFSRITGIKEYWRF